jgi:prolyl-tRNA synthetase
MRLSQLFTRTQKDSPSEEKSRNAALLTRAGYVSRLMAGVYSYLPLGVRVLSKLETIVREEMNAVGAHEILLPALHPRENWDRTGRWDAMDVLFKFRGSGDRDLCLGPTHEEIVTPLVGRDIRSYRDLPVVVYQIQTKFRNEARARSGLLRGREFRMKDMYSFHADQAGLDACFDDVTHAYGRVFTRCGIGSITIPTYASGGAFSKYSLEFQTLTPYGEDTIYRFAGSDVAVNKEVLDDPDVLQQAFGGNAVDAALLQESKAIEVGNIFKLGARFSDAFGLSYLDAAGKTNPIVMGCYGLGPSRVMGAIAECLSDDRGLVWPEEIAPYRVHLVSLLPQPAETSLCWQLYAKLCLLGIEVLYDDRPDARAGEKLADADLLGIPHRIVIGKRTVSSGQYEWKARTASESSTLSEEGLLELLMSSCRAPAATSQ